LVPCRSDGGSEDCGDLRGLVAGIERGVHDIGRDEGGIAGTEDAPLTIDPLLDLPSKDKHHLFLVGMLVETVSFARIEIDLDHGELLGARAGRIAEPPGRSKVIDLELGFIRDNESTRHRIAPHICSLIWQLLSLTECRIERQSGTQCSKRAKYKAVSSCLGHCSSTRGIEALN